MTPNPAAARLNLRPRPVSLAAGALSIALWIAAGFVGTDAGFLLVYAAGALSALALLTLLRIPRAPACDSGPQGAAMQPWCDPLTGLAGMASFKDHLERAVARARRDLHPLAVLRVEAGHAGGADGAPGIPARHQILKQAAQKIETCLRSGDIVARCGDGGFLVALPELRQPEDAFRIAWKLAHAIREAAEAGGCGIGTTGAVGVSLYPDDGSDAAALCESAGKAIERARSGGVVAGCSAELGELAAGRMELERRLRGALEGGELALFYQPQFDLKTRKLSALEALLRWNHPQRGVLRPEHFLPLAEECGLMLKVDQWVLHAACRQIRQVRRIGGMPLRIAVNVSQPMFLGRDFEQIVKQAIRENDIEPDSLVMELSERWVAKDLDQSRRKIERLRKAGVRIAIDDFGAGGASLSLLQSLPVDSLKIDRSFIRDLGVYPRNARLVGSIIRLAHGLELPTVAEAVESIPQWKALRALGCDLAQGYLFGMPLPASSLSRWISFESVFCAAFRRAVTPMASNPKRVAQLDVHPLDGVAAPARQLLDAGISVVP